MSNISKIKVSGVVYDIKDSQAREDLASLDERVEELEQHGTGGGIPDAPSDGKQYARKDGAWSEVQGSEPTVTVEPADDDIPRLFVWGNTLPTTKTDTDFEFRYISDTADFSGYCVMKCQGNSSMSYAKKNFTIKLFSDSAHETKLKKNFKGWGKENKFVLKANFIDHSHSRNIVCANLWSELVGIRSNYASLPERYRNSPRHGAIDGFPIKLYANGTYQGIYTWNIPKDKWMADMDDDLETDCILCGENYIGGCFRGAWGGTETTGWTDELHDTAPQSIITRWNEVITFVRTSNDAEFKANLSDYFDVESLIDYYLFGIYTTGFDAFGKNQLYFTYDGIHWIAGMYDMDSTIGLWWNGQSFVSASYARAEFEDYKNSTGNLLYKRLEELFIPEIKARKTVIRENVITEANMDSKFENWWYRIGTELLTEDGNMWNAPSKTTNNVTQLRNYIRDRLIYADSYIDGLVTPIPCTGISLDEDSISFSDNTPQTLTATLQPSDTTDEVVWSTSNASIATVVNGIVTPHANGNCTITATCGDYSATCAVSVSMSQDIPCTSISLNKSTLSFGIIGSSQTLVATPEPTDTTDAVVWTTSDASIATVVNGVVTSVANGNATITVTCGEQTATCTVTVEEIGNPLANVTWYDNQVYDKITGELKTTSNEHVSSKFTLDDGPWTLNINDSNCRYAAVFCWDADGKFQLQYAEIANTKTSMTFVAVAGYQYAVRFYGTGDRTKLSMDKQVVTEPANPLTINLSELTWSLAGNVNVGIRATIPSIPAPINTVKLNYPIDWYRGGSENNTTGPTSMTDTSLHFTFVGPSNLYCRCFGTTADAINAAQTYFTENNSQIIINGD